LLLGSLLRLGSLYFRPPGLGGCAAAKFGQSRLDPTELGFELLDLVLDPLAGLRAAGFFAPLVLTGLRATGFFAPLVLTGLRAAGFFAPLPIAEFFLAALDHAPLGLAVVSIAGRSQATVAGRVGFLVDAFRPGHALLGAHRRNGSKPHFLGDPLSN
jgi:hypothetical protein